MTRSAARLLTLASGYKAPDGFLPTFCCFGCAVGVGFLQHDPPPPPQPPCYADVQVSDNISDNKRFAKALAEMTGQTVEKVPLI
jgi:hypothetical protein